MDAFPVVHQPPASRTENEIMTDAANPVNGDQQAELLEQLGRLRPGSENTVLVVEDEMAAVSDPDPQAHLNDIVRATRKPMFYKELQGYDLAAELRVSWAAQQALRGSITVKAQTDTPATTWELFAPKTAPGSSARSGG